MKNLQLNLIQESKNLDINKKIQKMTVTIFHRLNSIKLSFEISKLESTKPKISLKLQNYLS